MRRKSLPRPLLPGLPVSTAAMFVTCVVALFARRRCLKARLLWSWEAAPVIIRRLRGMWGRALRTPLLLVTYSPHRPQRQWPACAARRIGAVVFFWALAIMQA